MGQEFDDFVADLMAALASSDEGFIRKVYQDWVDTSGVLPAEYVDTFPQMVLAELGPMAECPTRETETFEDFGIVHFVNEEDPDETTSLTFKQTGDGWIMFNERSGFINFKKVYTLSYDVQGGQVAIRFNGKRHPLISEPDQDVLTAFVTPINSALNVGANEANLVLVSGTPEVQLRINSEDEGEIADSSDSNVLLWEGTVTEDMSLSFEAE